MLRLLRYDSDLAIPLGLEVQIRSLLSAEWPGADDEDLTQPLTAPEFHPRYFVVADGEQVLSYARTIWTMVWHRGQHFKLYGVGDVITAPEVRYQGYGGRIVAAATTDIQADREADLALLRTEPRLETFYRRSGWAYAPGLQIVTREEDELEDEPLFAMMLFLSAQAQAARKFFPLDPLVLPGDEW
jgi:aminoglycoside 2'-N-acetyltransferase I